MQSATVPLLNGVTFEVPRDYARVCGGHPVRVYSSSAAKDNLIVAWDDRVLSFASSGGTVEFDRASVFGLVADESEQLMGMVICTLRIGAIDDKGRKGSSVILSAFDPRAKTSFAAVVSSLRNLSLPVRFFETSEEMYRST
jgi:hypothetical protein